MRDLSTAERRCRTVPDDGWRRLGSSLEERAVPGGSHMAFDRATERQRRGTAGWHRPMGPARWSGRDILVRYGRRNVFGAGLPGSS